MLEKIATDTYSFKDIREGNFTYIDKTAQLIPMVDGSIGKQFFIARPRRFGKSLMISTLQCLFEGRRELFQGLAIEPQWDWSKRWPVLHLDMGSCQADTVERFWHRVNVRLTSESERLGIPLRKDEPTISGRFEYLINDIADRAPDGKMVLLIDEYDKPLLGHLGKPEVLEFRDALKEFYSVVKTLEGRQRFAMLTGISKFSMSSVFSDLNNLNDLTLSRSAMTLLGFTCDEIVSAYPKRIGEIAINRGISEQNVLDELAAWCGGYRFYAKSPAVFNPSSVEICMASGQIINSCSNKVIMPEFLRSLVSVKPCDFNNIVANDELLGAYEPDRLDLVNMLFNFGYLTITRLKVRNLWRVYTLDFPNREMREAFDR